MSPEGSTVFVTGWSGGSDDATIAYSAADGSQLWTAFFGGGARSLAVSPDGSKMFVIGYSELPITSSYANLIITSFKTVAYSAEDGSQLWEAHYAGGSFARSVAVSPDGSRVFVTGDPFSIVAHSAASGDQLWSWTYNGPGNRPDSALHLLVSPDGSKVFVAGESSGTAEEYDLATLAFQTTSCANGNDEGELISGALHEYVERRAGPLAPYVHGVNCDVVSANAL